MIRSSYNVVMDPERNPLQALPKLVRFQYMAVLAYMWSVVFCLYIGAIALIGPSIAVHTILLVGVFFTADIFRRAGQQALSHDNLLRLHRGEPRAMSYDEMFKDPRDGGAMYDDVWGAPPQPVTQLSR